jgi:hypothetical protein
MSRLLASIERELAAPADAGSHARALIRKAIYCARDGAFDQAVAAIASLRALQSGPHFGTCIAGANLAEGVVATYSGNFNAAIDKLRRASAIANSGEPNWLGRLVWAWQAHAYQLLLRPEGIAGLAASILKTAQPEEHDVLSRLFSVFAVGLHISDSYERARPWYDAAHQQALAEGDELTIDANLYNVAAYRIHNTRLRQIIADADANEIERANWEIQSSENFDRIKQGTTFLWSLPLYAARAAMLKRDFKAALLLLDEWTLQHGEGVPPDHMAAAVADRAMCLAVTGELRKGVQLIAEVLHTLPVDISDDELAIVYFRASQIAALGGDVEQAALDLGRARDRLARFQQLQRIWLNALSAIDLPASHTVARPLGTRP